MMSQERDFKEVWSREWGERRRDIAAPLMADIHSFLRVSEGEEAFWYLRTELAQCAKWLEGEFGSERWEGFIKFMANVSTRRRRKSSYKMQSQLRSPWDFMVSAHWRRRRRSDIRHLLLGTGEMIESLEVEAYMIRERKLTWYHRVIAVDRALSLFGVARSSLSRWAKTLVWEGDSDEEGLGADDESLG